MLAWAALLALGGAAVAQAGWSEPQTLEHTVTAAAGNARGEEAFTWRVPTPAKLRFGVSGLRVSYVRARLRLPDGRLTPPQSISRTHGVVARPAAIGLDAHGTATAVWTEVRPRTGVRSAIMVAVRAPGGRFGRPVEVGQALLGDDVKLAVAGDGAAVIVRLSRARISALQRPAGRCATGRARACFGPVQVIYSLRCSPIGLCEGVVGGPLDSLDVMFGPDDRAYVAWLGVGGARLAVTHGRRFGQPLAIPTSGESPELAVLPSGRAVLAWLTRSARNLTLVRAAVSDPAGRRLSVPQTVPSRWVSGYGDCANLQLRANRQGETTLVWECLPIRGAHRMIAAAVRRPGGDFGPGTALSPADRGAAQPALAVDAEGTTILVYNVEGTILAHVRRPRRGFDAAVPVGTGRPSQADYPLGPGRPSQALGAGGIVTVAWPGLRPNTTMLSDWTP
jgi:hypothetical protein